MEMTPFFPLPWWERIKVRGEPIKLFQVRFKTPNLDLNLRFHPHPDYLPSREKKTLLPLNDGFR